jgi:hypothetical protein
LIERVVRRLVEERGGERVGQPIIPFEPAHYAGLVFDGRTVARQGGQPAREVLRFHDETGIGPGIPFPRTAQAWIVIALEHEEGAALATEVEPHGVVDELGQEALRPAAVPATRP